MKPHIDQQRLLQGKNYRFHAMVKPTGAQCNIDCHYCFYLHKTELLNHGKRSQMNDITLEQHIRQYIESQTGDEVVFSWQGGEPTLMGLDFFHKIIALQKKYQKSNQRIENDLQTNGTLLNDEWIDFLKTHNFHVGLSIDGPRDLHDTYRKTRKGLPTFESVIQAAKLLKDADIPFATLCVVNRTNALYPKEVYRFLADELGTWRIQFTPAVEPKTFQSHSTTTERHDHTAPMQNDLRARPASPDSIVTGWSVDPIDYGNFLCAVWDEWIQTDIGRIHVNLFETAIAQAAGMPAQMCTQAEFCGKALAVEHNGDVYACDHFVYPDFHIGNIHQTHLGNLAFSEIQHNFGFNKLRSLPKQCQQCSYLRLCYGECPKNRIIRTNDGENGLNYLCSGLYAFYHHIGNDVVNILRKLGAIS